MITSTERRRRAPVVAVGVAALLIVGTIEIGFHLVAGGTNLHLLDGLILRGGWDPRLSRSVLPPIVVGLGIVIAAPRLARELAWGALLASSALAAAAWAVCLALTDGVAALGAPLASPYEYLHDVGRVGSWGTLLSGFAADIPADAANAWTTHVAGHPPGALLAFAGLSQLGLGGSGWAAALCIAAGASAVPAVLIAVRAVVEEETARSAAPFLVLAPTALWVATSADALFLGVSAWGIAALAVAARQRSDRLALLGGVVMGLTLFLSYGLVLLGPIALVVLTVQRRWRPLLIAAVGLAVVVVAFALAGFWWLDGLHAASVRVTGGPGALDRPSSYFVLANLAASAIVLGPAGVAGIGALVNRTMLRSRTALLPLAALSGILIANFSLLSKGEVERIYLPFFPWILTATVLLAPRQRRGWLVLQLVSALAVQLLIKTEW